MVLLFLLTHHLNHLSSFRGALYSSYWPITPTKDKPEQIAEMVTLKRRTTDVVFNLIYPDGHVDSIALQGAPLERHKDYEVLYVK